MFFEAVAANFAKVVRSEPDRSVRIDMFVSGRWATHLPIRGSCVLQHLASRLDVMNRLGRALVDPTRARILLRLLDGSGYPARLAEELQLTRTNVSNHLACLRGCGIVVAVPEGRSTRYEIADPHLSRALDALVDLVLAVDDGAECADEDCDVPLCFGVSA